MTKRLSFTVYDVRGIKDEDCRNIEREFERLLIENLGSEEAAIKAFEAERAAWDRQGEWPCDDSADNETMTSWQDAYSAAWCGTFEALGWMDLPRTGYVDVSVWESA